MLIFQEIKLFAVMAVCLLAVECSTEEAPPPSYESCSNTPDNNVVIVSGEEPPRDAKCARACAGTTGRKNTKWDYIYSGDQMFTGKMKTKVDMTTCGFVTIPTITTSLESKYSSSTPIGSMQNYVQ